MKYIIAIIFSILLHFVLTVFLIRDEDKKGKEHDKPPKPPVTLKIIEEGKEKTPPKVKKKAKLKNIAPKKDSFLGLPCKSYYTGIGVQHDPASCLVLSVPFGYPAYKAGIQAGDLIVEPACGEILGPEGTTVKIKIMRGIQVLNFYIVRGKICEQS